MKKLQPRTSTPVPGSTGGRLLSSGRMPADVVSDQISRVVVFAAVGIALWAIGLLMDTVVVPSAVGIPINTAAAILDVLGLSVTILLFLYFKYSPHAPDRKIDLGLFYMVFCSALVGLINTWQQSTIDAASTHLHLSWIAIIILVSSMILITTPGKILAACLIAASMDPLAAWVAHLRGLVLPGPATVIISAVPNYVCAFVALLPSSVLRHLGKRLSEAREMGSYTLVELLGHGGMGEVWRAHHRLLARSAAIKLVRPELLGASNQDEVTLALRRFEREAQATAALSSPHTIRLFDFGTTDEGAFYYVMELLSGRDLESLVREFGPLPADRVVFLLRQVCHSLADAHARGLVHRDIKPANIYVCRMGLDYDFVKVLDFGLVKVKGGTDSTIDTLVVTGAHATTGTPAYMAPELIIGGAEVDRRADVYALGCVAYFLLTGQLVFEADTPMKMLLQHLQATPVPPSAKTELPVPPELDEFILSCLEKDPAKRPQDAAALYQAACSCTSGNSWNSDSAQVWWEQHLASLTGPLSLTEPREQTAESVSVQ